MRSIYSFLILVLACSLSFANDAPKDTRTLLQARGLTVGKCYREVASLSCEKSCVIDFFPTTQAQLSLDVQEISTLDRKKLGRLFEADFQFLNSAKVKIFKLRPLDSKQLKEKIRSSGGYFNSVGCLKR